MRPTARFFDVTADHTSAAGASVAALRVNDPRLRATRTIQLLLWTEDGAEIADVAAFAPDGSSLAVARSDGSLALIAVDPTWQRAPGTRVSPRIFQLSVPGVMCASPPAVVDGPSPGTSVLGLSFSPDARRLVAGLRAGLVCAWELPPR